MKIGKKTKGLAVGLGVLGFAVYPATCDTINQTGISGFTYTGNNTGQGSANKGRAISSVTLANNASDLFVSIALNPNGNATSQGGFDYLMVMTSGNPSAGGDTSADATTDGNAYDRAISIDSGFGGMTDMIGIYTPNTSSPYSFGFNDWAFIGGVWVQENTYATGVTIVNGSGGNPTVLTLTAPLSDFPNLTLTPGSTFDFDVDSTGTGAGQTAYGDLANTGTLPPGSAAPLQGGTYYVNGTSYSNTGTYSATAQDNLTQLDQYTIAAVPEPGLLSMAGGLGGLFLVLFSRQRK